MRAAAASVRALKLLESLLQWDARARPANAQKIAGELHAIEEHLAASQDQPDAKSIAGDADGTLVQRVPPGTKPPYSGKTHGKFRSKLF